MPAGLGDGCMWLSTPAKRARNVHGWPNLMTDNGATGVMWATINSNLDYEFWFLTATTLTYTTRVEITTAANTRFVLLLVLINGFEVYSFHLWGYDRILWHYFSLLLLCVPCSKSKISWANCSIICKLDAPTKTITPYQLASS